MTSWWSDTVWAAARSWGPAVAVLAAVGAVTVVAAYLLTRGAGRVRLVAATLKVLALAALLLCLLEPMRSEQRPRPGANLMVVLADNSRSVGLNDAEGQSIQSQMFSALDDQQWQTRLAQDFDVRKFSFDERLNAVGDWEQLSCDGRNSHLASALTGIQQRFAGRPLAGVVLLSDGNATDDLAQWTAANPDFPPIHAVKFPSAAPAPDISIRQLSVRQTNFEESPVSVSVEIAAQGAKQPEEVAVELFSEQDELLDRAVVAVSDDKNVSAELRVRPEASGLHLYKVRVSRSGEPAATEEATLANNQRLTLVHRRNGPYRLLYVSGRPNWEFKYLRRAAEEDREIELVGLLRIARREPKFVFGDRALGKSNPLFQGFAGQDPDDVEQYDQPVIVRIGVEDSEELRDGFPKDAADLYGFHAVILDDVEARFFDQDQLSLLQQFVSQRGGGLLALGGAGAFASGGYDRTPVGDMLPVYLDGPAPQPLNQPRFRLRLTRDGWLQPWVRMRANEGDERQRLDEMPEFETVNQVRRVKPGATVMAEVLLQGSDQPVPALAVQRYGKGRTGALLIGDFWKWALSRRQDGSHDLEKAWRQLLRWLVADVAQRVEATAKAGDATGQAMIRVEVRDEKFEPLDNAEVVLSVRSPDDRQMELRARQGDKPGVYEAAVDSREAGAYRVQVSAAAPDGSDIGEAVTGWTHEPDAAEFRQLAVNDAALQRLAEATSGDRPPVDRMEQFVSQLSKRKAVVNETWLRPLWHHWFVFLFAALCLGGEWGLRRWHGLP